MAMTYVDGTCDKSDNIDANEGIMITLMSARVQVTNVMMANVIELMAMVIMKFMIPIMMVMMA